MVPHAAVITFDAERIRRTVDSDFCLLHGFLLVLGVSVRLDPRMDVDSWLIPGRYDDAPLVRIYINRAVLTELDGPVQFLHFLGQGKRARKTRENEENKRRSQFHVRSPGY